MKYYYFKHTTHTYKQCFKCNSINYGTALHHTMDSSKITLVPTPDQRDLGDGYLKLRLNQNIFGVLPIKHTQEVLILPVESVTSIPNMPNCVLGLMNWRNRVVWAVDLQKMLDLEPPKTRVRQYNVIIVRYESIILGLVVLEIKGTIKLMSDLIQSPSPQIPVFLQPYLIGCVNQDSDMLLVLDVQSILRSSLLLNN